MHGLRWALIILVVIIIAWIFFGVLTTQGSVMGT